MDRQNKGRCKYHSENKKCKISQKTIKNGEIILMHQCTRKIDLMIEKKRNYINLILYRYIPINIANLLFFLWKPVYKIGVIACSSKIYTNDTILWDKKKIDRGWQSPP